jgi:diguanylate cyclase (GGDEF)-like protein
LLLYGCFIVGIKNADPSLFHFAVFSILLAFWSITESPICDLLNRWPLGAMILDHYALMAMPTVFVMFIRHVFTDKSNPLWNIYLHLNGGIILLRTLLQIISLYDLKQTLWMTQLSIILFTITGVLLGIHELKNFKPTRQMRLNVICLLILFGATLLELLLFRIFQKSSVYGMLGFVFYVVVMSTEIIKKSRKMIARAQEAELYQKLAYTDELTGVYNRMAFRHDMDSQMTLDPATNTYAVKPTTLFMFDLNDLKRCNDTFGHENGDRYIKMISDVLIKAFGIDGKCYRIGGDEFSAIMPNVNQNEIDNKLITILRSVQELNNAGFVVPVSVAVGYSVFDPEQDKTLDDTLKRADELMYQNKLKIKQALHAM